MLLKFQGMTSAAHCVQEEFFIEQSLEKAISIDEWTGESLTSSMVDDVFYILRLCSYRALETINLQALTSILGQLNALLVNNLAQALEQRWKVACFHHTCCSNSITDQIASSLQCLRRCIKLQRMYCLRNSAGHSSLQAAYALC